MEGFADFEFEFPEDEPVDQFEQLLSIMPFHSHRLFPKAIREELLSPRSEIYDLYPEDFFVDLENKDAAWKGEILLPF